MARKKAGNQVRIEREERDLAAIFTTLPRNPIPWAAVVQLVAPIVARLAVRYALKRLKRGMSEQRVNEVADLVGARVGALVSKEETTHDA